MRKAGLRPDSVMLSIDCPYRKPVYQKDFQCMELTVHGSVVRDDFRSFKGLDVIFYVPEWNQLAADALEKLKLYANEITVLCAEYGQDIGYFWSSEFGAFDFDEYPWVLKFHNARRSVCRTKQQTQERLSIEAECIKHVPQLGEVRGSISHS